MNSFFLITQLDFPTIKCSSAEKEATTRPQSRAVFVELHQCKQGEFNDANSGIALQQSHCPVTVLNLISEEV